MNELDIFKLIETNTKETLTNTESDKKPIINKNNFSYWFPKIKNCNIRVPESKIFKVPELVQKSFYCYDSGMPEKEWNKNIDKWLETTIYPEMTGIFSISFNKNALFSDKFNYVNCISRKDNIKLHIININYEALCFGANGIDELILRERIEYDMTKTPTIYNGMPLRNEFRVFYDFDTNEVLYIVNYWDYDYCYSRISYNYTDKIIFDHEREKLELGYENHKNEVIKLISKYMKNIDLTGKWSIDILLDETSTYWLIDMALAENSAYWKEK